MGQSLTPYESISYELNQFIERRVAQRRALQRDSSDRRQPAGDRKNAGQEKNSGTVPGADQRIPGSPEK